MEQGKLPFAGVRELFHMFGFLATPFVKRRLALAICASIGISLLASIAPLVLKWIVDSFGTERRTTHVAAPILVLVVLYIASQWFSRVLSGIQAYVHAQAERRMYRALSDRLFDHVIRLPLRYHLSCRTGAVSEILNNGLVGFQMVQQVLLMSVVPILVQIGTVSVVLTTLNQNAVLLLLLAAIAAYGWVFQHGATRSNKVARTVSVAQIEARALMTDSILNYETVKFFTAEKAVRERLDAALRRSERDWVSFHKARARNSIWVATVFTAFAGTTMAYAVLEVTAGSMSVGTFVLVSTYLMQLVAPIEGIGVAALSMAQGLAFLERMLELFRERAEPADAGRTPPLDGPGELTFDDVTVGYVHGRPTLKHISFVLGAGKTLGIVGASGAGKTTLVRLLTRLLEPETGRILIDGASIHDMEIGRVRGAVAVVPQDTVLFNDSIAVNIAFGRPGCAQEEVEAAAKIARLHDFIVRLPEGYQTRVGERGVRLSGGEKQRVAIARAALKRPRIFVFDEATSSLDSRTEKEILDNLRQLAVHCTTVVIAHRLSTVVHADCILVLDRGVVVEQGTHDELLAQEGRYAQLWYAQLNRAGSDDVSVRQAK